MFDQHVLDLPPRQSSRRLECGCRALSGWNTETFKPFYGVDPCSKKHKDEALAACARYEELPPSDRLAAEVLAELMEEELATQPASDLRQP
jgi:hypothetical protein